MNPDKIKGMLMAVALGDALGAPHEFNYQHNEYTGKLIHEVKLFNRFHGETNFGIGSITDDTQMTLTLANQIIKDNFDSTGHLIQGEPIYNKNNVVLAYENWAKTSKMLGKNTRALFKGVVTVKGYENRYNKIFSSPVEEWTQSNGSLMRCSPLIIYPTFNALIIDTAISNPHPVNRDCGIIYTYILKMLANDKQLPPIEELLNYTREKVIIDAILDVRNKVVRDIALKSVRGWVVTAFYCALYSIYHIPNINEAFRIFIIMKGDTDTNAAILGALYGAKLGFDKLYNDEINRENIDIIIKNNSILNNIDDISEKLFKINIKQ